MVTTELESYPWPHAIWTEDKLIAVSPFRHDHTPSFYVWLRDQPTARAGDFGDPGATNPEYKRGGFVKLLAFLRDETEEETREYLAWKYGGNDRPVDVENLTLDLTGVLQAPVKQRTKPLDIQMLDEYKFRHPYLGSRGISETVQRLMRVGYSKRTNAIVIPWFMPDGSLGNVKFRRVDEKTFWYAKGGVPLRQLVYGIDVIYSRRIKRAVIVEAEVDAMYVMSAGIPAIAIGGTGFSEIKRDLIVKSPLEEVVVLADHDEPGQALKRRLVAELSPYINVSVAGYPIRYKDANEIGDLRMVAKIVELAKPYQKRAFKLVR